MKIRSPIISVLGHVDHGKTLLLDQIRQSSIAAKEAGGITQCIGCSFIPLETIKKICRGLLKTLKISFTIPGLVIIDTPGHAAFTNIRKRGGNLADIAILVIDINEGLKPQTFESIDILKQYKTPFVIALNKIDLIRGWQSKKGRILEIISQQSENIRNLLDQKLYSIVGKLSELGFNSERFDRVEDHTKQIAIIPTSAKTGEGIPELLMVITGLSQKFLENNLRIEVKGYAKGTVIEVKKDPGLGIALDTIIYDGTLKLQDTIVIGTLTKPIVTKVKALFEPMPLKEMRDKKSKFLPVKEVTAASGVKISALEIEEVVAGMPLKACSEEEIESVKEKIQKEVEEVLIETDNEGIIIKADSLGSLEALVKLLKERNIPIRKASIGLINKNDIADAESMHEKEPLQAVILAFNTEFSADTKENEKVKVFIDNVIYKLIDKLEEWQKLKIKEKEQEKLQSITRPCKIKLLPGYVFRQSNPAVVGVEIIAGTLKTGIKLFKESEALTEVKSMQQEQKTIEKAEKNTRLAVSLPGVTVGRQIKEDDILYSDLIESEFRKLKELKDLLSPEEIQILKEIAEKKRKENPMWGI